ncbi:MAG: hypothetical protein DCE90_02715 [Pseudanabaena sp.]|nr:MAG: hypothetical protein DCE90_02715 [Pseudanabaena sp.]
MAKKRQLNVRLPDSLLDQLEERVIKTKMGMAAMVEVLLVQALQQQDLKNEPIVDERIEDLVKRVEAIECHLGIEPSKATKNEASILTVESVPTNITTDLSPSDDAVPVNPETPSHDVLGALNAEQLATRLGVTERAIHQKKDKNTFSDWSKKHDSDEIAWKYVAAEDSFCPIAK